MNSFAACAGGCADDIGFGLAHDLVLYMSVALALLTPGVMLFVISNIGNHNK
jgi:hypothetical protein